MLESPDVVSKIALSMKLMGVISPNIVSFGELLVLGKTSSRNLCRNFPYQIGWPRLAIRDVERSYCHDTRSISCLDSFPLQRESFSKIHHLPIRISTQG